ncbi:protein GDAP2 homolog [Ostrinia nubilalis]|uniref:protein GDAP2 homolog n=1 Tax=Ostrinia nubilalis TaxID=29057 RepID=UPI003082477C
MDEAGAPFGTSSRNCTIRRYLDQNPTPALVILACARAADAALYASIAPAYFPRSAAEQRAGPAADHERRIRIIHNPHSHNADSGECRRPPTSREAPPNSAPGPPPTTSGASASYTTRTRTTPTAVSAALVMLPRAAHPHHTQPALYASIAPAYFPRSAAEQRAGPAADHERRIRIIHNPHSHNADSAEDDASLCDEDAAVEAAAAFARACAPDTQRLLAPAPAPYVDRRLLDDHEQYERLLRRARTEDLSEVSGIGCLYQSGVDRLGRPVVIFIGKWFPIGDIDLDKALLYLIKLLDPIVRGDYVIAYFHTLASSANHPPFSWLKEVYTVLPYKYKKNLKAFYIVHPTFWTKMMTWWFTTFMAPAIKAKVHSLPGVEYLYSVMARDQLELPAFVTEYDMTINGLHYFQPDTNNT